MPIATPTLIIGASSAGLAAARQLQERGLAYMLVDQAEQVGTMWRNAYERLTLHTPRSRSGLPFLPMPASYPRYPSRQQVVEYLETYAAQLKSPPQFGRKVHSVARSGTRWLSRTSGGDVVSDAVVIATGNTRVAVIPTLPGAGDFAGTMLHSSQYRNGDPYRGQRVVVVGLGNSAAEIAVDLADHGAWPTLSVRGPVNVIPRDILGIPSVNLGLVQTLFPARIADAINAPIIGAIIGDITRLGLRRLPYGPVEQVRTRQQIPLIDHGTIALIRSGAIAVRPGIDRLTADGAIFADGRTEHFAAVVLGTGYRPALADLLADVDGVLDPQGAPIVNGGATAAPGLYFCGFRVASGGTLREAGLESGRIARLIAARRSSN
jgi:indole-3-pyruvate monooxygenase